MTLGDVHLKADANDIQHEFRLPSVTDEAHCERNSMTVLFTIAQKLTSLRLLYLAKNLSASGRMPEMAAKTYSFALSVCS